MKNKKIESIIDVICAVVFFSLVSIPILVLIFPPKRYGPDVTDYPAVWVGKYDDVKISFTTTGYDDTVLGTVTVGTRVIKVLASIRYNFSEVELYDITDKDFSDAEWKNNLDSSDLILSARYKGYRKSTKLTIEIDNLTNLTRAGKESLNGVKLVLKRKNLY